MQYTENYLIYANYYTGSNDIDHYNVNYDSTVSAKVCNETNHSNDIICATYDATWCVPHVNVTLVSKTTLKYGLSQLNSIDNIHCKAYPNHFNIFALSP